ncbi:MAG TPA: hypothetical protein ENJ19_10800 [Gammaproteobacteria bacterium]|nr:hypothetical protein [Gammaproteobacteria bacterium]
MKQLWLYSAAVLTGMPAMAQDYYLGADVWAAPRSGAVVLAMAPVAAAVRHYLGAPDQRLILSYPGGESGNLWASELRDWLVALGLPSARLQLQAGAADSDRIRLSVRPLDVDTLPVPAPREAP